MGRAGAILTTDGSFDLVPPCKCLWYSFVALQNRIFHLTAYFINKTNSAQRVYKCLLRYRTCFSILHLDPSGALTCEPGFNHRWLIQLHATSTAFVSWVGNVCNRIPFDGTLFHSSHLFIAYPSHRNSQHTRYFLYRAHLREKFDALHTLRYHTIFSIIPHFY